jgi:aminoglycoside 3-N-acetyltransferase
MEDQISRLQKIVARTSTPRTVASLASDLAALGVKKGDTLVVHSSLSSIGFVVGDEVAVIQALQQAVTEQGSIVMPAYSTAISDPALWENPPVPEEWWQIIRDTMPLFDPTITPTLGIGAIPEAFRKFPGVLRSRHPASSWCAWGAQAERITQEHSLSYSYGLRTPLGRLYTHVANAKILLIGVNFSSCSALHLSEILSGVVPTGQCGAPGLDEQGNRKWIQYEDLDYGGDGFADIGHELEQTGSVTTGHVGSAACKLVDFRTCVDFATQWIKNASNK